jgi:hypothetical protein
VPSGLSQVRRLVGHASMKARSRSIVAAVRGRSGKPSRAYSMARAATSANLSVPQRSRTVSAACSAPGTTAGSSPWPRSVFCRSTYHSIVACRGAQPWPTTAVTLRSRVG